MEVVMTTNVLSAIGYTWEGLGIVWLAGLAFTKRTVRSQSVGPRLFYMALAILGFSLLASRWFEWGWMAKRFLPEMDGLEMAGLTLTVFGCLFAIWARLTLGSNWSGRATVKEDHELIVKGPYSMARHPIYSGILLASLGTMLAIGEWRCVLGMVVIVIMLLVKMSQEERLMMETFPDAYPRYRRRVKALVPGVV
jgi:protein-S-isoprenylcysteine O-methyltransferase Ste14